MDDDRRVVVIGTGPTGAIAALTLSERGVPVTMLEAGSRSSAFGLTVRIAGVTLVNVRRPLHERNGLVKTGDPDVELWEDLAAGGLSNHWAAAVPRFSPDDFRDGERAGDAYRWPLGYDELVPWYEHVEALLRVSGAAFDVPQLPASRVSHVRRLADDWSAVACAAQSLGRSVLPLPYSYDSETTLTFSGTRFNAFVRLLGSAVRARRVTVRFAARAERLEWSPERSRVSGVIYRDLNTGREEVIRCRAVVIAAGALNSAQLLMTSESAEFPEGLGNTEGVLGRYLHDHPMAKLIVDLDGPLSIHPAAYLSRPTLERALPLYAAAAVQWTGTAIRAKSVLRGTPGRLPWIGFNVVATMAPSAENGLIRDRRPSGSDRLALHLRRAAESDAALTNVRDDLLDLLDRAGMRPRTRLWAHERLGNSVHFGGTCRMHESRRFGMLDRWSRLHAVPNVVVADSSAFTTGPEKNPTLTAMALSARGSDRLAHDLRSGSI